MMLAGEGGGRETAKGRMLNCVSLSHLMVEKIDEDVMGVHCERLVCSYSHSSTVLSDQSSSEQNMMTHSVSHVKSWLSVCKVMTMPWGIHRRFKHVV